jgi:hypothetical protein
VEDSDPGGGLRSGWETPIRVGDSDPGGGLRSGWGTPIRVGDSDPGGRLRSGWETPIRVGDSDPGGRLRSGWETPIPPIRVGDSSAGHGSLSLFKHTYCSTKLTRLFVSVQPHVLKHKAHRPGQQSTRISSRCKRFAFLFKGAADVAVPRCDSSAACFSFPDGAPRFTTCEPTAARASSVRASAVPWRPRQRCVFCLACLLSWDRWGSFRANACRYIHKHIHIYIHPYIHLCACVFVCA